MKVAEVMTRDPAYCRSNESLARAAQLMWERDCGCIPVVDDEARVVGIVTDRDISMAAFHARRRLDEMPVAQTMAKAPVAVTPRDPISEALHIMELARVRRLPVVDDAGRLVGVLSLHDLARSATEEHRWLTGVTLREVAKTFAEVSSPRKPLVPPHKNNPRHAVPG